MLKKYFMLLALVTVVGWFLAINFLYFCEEVPENKQLKQQVFELTNQTTKLNDAFNNSIVVLEENKLIEKKDSVKYYIPFNITKPSEAHHKVVDFYNFNVAK